MRRVLIIVSMLTFFSINLMAKNSSLLIMRECLPTQSSCELLKDVEGRDYHGSLIDRIEITKESVVSAKMTKSNGQVAFIGELNKEYGELFAELTQKNIGKRILMVVDKVVLSAPVVRSRITGGEFQISFGKDQNLFFEKLKWLEKISEMKEQNRVEVKENNLNLFLIIGLMLFLGGAFYLFKSRK